jgi:hypothetical protein
MTPAGYMAKKTCRTPDWLKNDAVQDIFSVSGCISETFCDYIPHWKHNGYWLFNCPALIQEVAAAAAVNLSEYQFFYYEIHENQFDEHKMDWEPFEPENSFETAVFVPTKMRLEGYDVVNFFARTSPECSPLSCNHMAETVPVNRHCLFASFDEAKGALERGAFEKCEPGPYRIFAVYSCAAA